MLQTVEAIYDPQKGLLFSETVTINAPMKVLVTFIEQRPFLPPKKGSAQALLATLKNEKRNNVILGTLKNAFQVPENFDDPLPDEIYNEFYKPEL